MEIHVLVLPGMRSFDVASALEVFADDRSDRGVPTNTVRLVSPLREVTLEHGFRVTAAPLDHTGDAPLLIIPGFADVETAFEPPVRQDIAVAVDHIREVHQRGGQLASLCTGAFLLAETGVLDGTVATTHWRYCERLQLRHSRVRVDPNVIHTHDESRRVWTSAGVTAGIDLCLAVVTAQQGASAASEIARSMVLPAARRGGQSQYVPVRYRAQEVLGTGLEELREQVRHNLSRPWSVGDLAVLARTSPRTLQRQFAAQTGTSVSRWLIDERLTAARELLESTTLAVEQVAARVGFTSADLFRKHFATRFGTSPSRYREAFGAPVLSPR